MVRQTSTSTQHDERAAALIYIGFQDRGRFASHAIKALTSQSVAADPLPAAVTWT